MTSIKIVYMLALNKKRLKLIQIYIFISKVKLRVIRDSASLKNTYFK